MDQKTLHPDEAKLRNFITYVDEMSGLRLIKSGQFKRLQFQMRIHRDKRTDETEITHKMTEIDNDDFRSFLLGFRLFILNGEPVYVDHILAIVYRYLKLEHRSMHKNVAAVWRKAKKGDGKTFFFDGIEVLSPEAIVDYWLHGEYFHRDSQKSVRANTWKDHELAFMYRKELYFAVHDMFNTITWIKNYIADGLQHSWLDFNSPQN